MTQHGTPQPHASAAPPARPVDVAPLDLDEGRTLVADLHEHLDGRVCLRGWVHHRRDLGGLAFLDLRDRTGVVQCVLEGTEPPLQESCVEVDGVALAHPKAPGGIEVRVSELRVITRACAAPPVEMAKIDHLTNADTLLAYRHVTVRSPRDRAVLKVQAELVAGFRAFLDGHGFTEISTPKIVAAGAEGGAHQFELDYYGQRAYLAQSPQLYKQILVGALERVYEVAPVYRAEPSHTVRHLAEYLSLDVEFGFLRDDGDVMDLQEAVLKTMLARVGERCAGELRSLGARLPPLDVAFPRIPLLEARELVRERYGHTSGGKDLDPEAERLIGRWALAEHGSDFVFVTRYPEAARPFYAYATGDGLTRGLDLIFRGTEITSGGQRAHEYDMLLRALEQRGLDPAGFESYLQVFRHGMPPHGGFAIGAERLTALLLDIANVRFARAFPRDGQRLQP